MPRLRRTLTFAAAVALLAAQATPVLAVARSAAADWACAPGEVATAASLGGSARGAALERGGKVFEKDTGQQLKALPAKARGQAAPGAAITVPVWFHVITDGAEGNVTDRQIQDQVAVLNRGFGGGEGGTDSGFSFTLAGITRTDNATWYASRSGGAEHAMKQALKRGGDGTLNVYSTSGGAYLGWAYLPEITDTAQAYLDGIVIDWRTMPHVSDAYLDAYDEGDTLVHEAGHWLNLEHTFYGQCNKTGDFVADTPPQKSPSSGCPVGNDTCRQAGLDPIHNYMDYSDDDCITEFTPGQAQRMADSWLLWRAS